jgi:primosomal protein N' (replication factor Y)
VPFGNRRLQGVVCALEAETDLPRVRDIADLLDPVPVVTPHQLRLGRWIAEYYAAPLSDVLAAMLPPGLGRKTVYILEPGSEPNGARLTDEQRLVLELVRRAERISRDEVQRELSNLELDRPLTSLLRRGLLMRTAELAPPRVTARKVRLATVTPAGQELLEDDAGLRRAPRQRAVLEYVAARGPVPLPELTRVLPGAQAAVQALQGKGLVETEEQEVRRSPFQTRRFTPTRPLRLSRAQQAAYGAVARALKDRSADVFLLHGVTGSGKTEVYLQAIDTVIRQGRQAVMMVPEISLTPQAVERVAGRFPGRVAVLHSKLSAGERLDEWQRIRHGEVDVVVGPRSALFAPLPHHGLIVVDEEHDPSYKQDASPRYHARDAAAVLGRLAGATVVFGSATPDVGTYYAARSGRIKLLELPDRPVWDQTPPPLTGHPRSADAVGTVARGYPSTDGCSLSSSAGTPPGRTDTEVRSLQITIQDKPVDTGNERDPGTVPAPGNLSSRPMPAVEVVDMRQELKSGNRSIFSRLLLESLHETLQASCQALLFLNRRGSATVVICRDCGFVVRCPNCDIPFTYHAHATRLICHRCDKRTLSPCTCPACRSPRIRYLGVGTQRVEEEVAALFPQARVARWDRDVTGGREAHERILQSFSRHEADILVGTQMIAKGLDFPLVTLVGVISADTGLHMPDFRAPERSFQLLTQVAGRAGRAGSHGGRLLPGSKVVIQTYTPEHYAIHAARSHDYHRFYREEMSFRHAAQYPPFARMIRFVYSSEEHDRCHQAASNLRAILKKAIREEGLPGIEIIGPAPCFVAKVKGRYYWQLIARGPAGGGKGLHRLLEYVPPGWSIDVDPVDLL